MLYLLSLTQIQNISHVLPFNHFITSFSLAQEWKDNKEALLEYIWATHYGVKGMVSNDLHNQEHNIPHLRSEMLILAMGLLGQRST